MDPNSDTDDGDVVGDEICIAPAAKQWPGDDLFDNGTNAAEAAGRFCAREQMSKATIKENK